MTRKIDYRAKVLSLDEDKIAELIERAYAISDISREAGWEASDNLKRLRQAIRGVRMGVRKNPAYELNVVMREYLRRASGFLATTAYWLSEQGQTDVDPLFELADQIDQIAVDIFDYWPPYDAYAKPLDLAEAMTVEEVADTYGLAASTVRGSIHKGYIAARKSGKNWLIRRADAEVRWGKRDA